MKTVGGTYFSNSLSEDSIEEKTPLTLARKGQIPRDKRSMQRLEFKEHHAKFELKKSSSNEQK